MDGLEFPSAACEYQTQALRVRDTLVAACSAGEESGWVSVRTHTKSNMALSRKESSSGGHVCGKAELFLNAAPEAVYHLLATLPRVKEWMPSCEMRRVSEVDRGELAARHGFTSLEVDYCTFQLYSPVAMRDWCFLRFACAGKDGTYVLGCENVAHPACPEYPGFIRGHLYPTGFVLRGASPSPPTTLMTVLFQFDVKGWLPSVLRTLFQSDYFLAQTTNVFMNGIRRAIEHRQVPLLPATSSLLDPSSVTSEDSFFAILKASNAEDSLGWHSVMNNDLEVHAKIVDDDLCVTKAIFKVHCTPESIYEVLSDDSRFHEFVPGLRELVVVERTVGSVSNPVKCLGNLTFDSCFDKVLKLTVASDLGCDVSFCLLQSSLYNSDDGTCVVLFRSVSHAAVSNEDAMGRILPSGFLITPLPDGWSLVSTAVQADIHSSFPPIIRALPPDQVCALLSEGFVGIVHRLSDLLSKSQHQQHHGLKREGEFADPPAKRFAQSYHNTPVSCAPSSAAPSSSPAPSSSKGSVPIMFNPVTNQLMPPTPAGTELSPMVAQFQHMASNSDQPAGRSGRRSERGRLIWTEELHGRFVKAVHQLGVDTARPQAILQLMNVDGLTAQHVKSHLQKFRGQLRGKPKGRRGDGDPPASHMKRSPSLASILTESSVASEAGSVLSLKPVPAVSPVPALVPAPALSPVAIPSGLAAPSAPLRGSAGRGKKRARGFEEEEEEQGRGDEEDDDGEEDEGRGDAEGQDDEDEDEDDDDDDDDDDDGEGERVQQMVAAAQMLAQKAGEFQACIGSFCDLMKAFSKQPK